MHLRSRLAGVAGFALLAGLLAMPAQAWEVCDPTDALVDGPCALPTTDSLAAKQKKKKKKKSIYQFNPRNPYAKKKPRDANQVNVKQLIVIGDEESVAGSGTKTWWEFQRDRGLFRKVTSLARAGATGGDTANDIKDQLDDLLQKRKKKKKKKKNKPRPDRFKASKKALTVVQLGLNDITQVFNTSELDTRWAFMRDQLDRLRAAGATAKNRRVFLVLPHDVGKQPGWTSKEASALRSFSIYWAGKLAQYATPPSNRFIAVDTLTFFDRVLANPTKWGINGAADLFSGTRFDAVYSEAGQRLLGGLVEHYLTQGWNWANTMDPGVSTTVAQLTDDINNGLIDAWQFATEAEVPVFGFAVGNARDEEARVGFAETPATDVQGFGLGWRLDSATALAFVHGESTTGMAYEYRRGEERAQARGGYEGLALLRQGEGWSWTVQLLWGREALTRSSADALSGQATRGETEARTLRLSQRLATSFELGSVTFAPWLGLDLARREVDGYAMDDPYVGRVRFGSATIEERTAEVGLQLTGPATVLEDVGVLRLSGEIAWTHDFSDRTVALALTEGRTRRVEQLELPSREALRLGLAASLVRENGLTLGADWAMVRGANGTDQQVGLRLRYRFPVD